MTSYFKKKHIFLIQITPNSNRKPVYYKLQNNQLYQSTKKEILSQKDNIIGYITFFLSWNMYKKWCAIFPANNYIWIFYDNEYIKIKKNSIKIIKKLFYRKIIIKIEKNKKLIIKLFTPPHRWLFNDGMFPEAVEPLIDILTDINQDYHSKLNVINNLPILLEKIKE